MIDQFRDVTKMISPDAYKRQVLEKIQVLVDAWIDFDGTTICYQKMNDKFVDLIEFACLTDPNGKNDE